MKRTNKPTALWKLLWLALCSFFLFALEARAQIEWRVSVKFILDANGHRPSGGRIDTDQDVRDQVDAANRLIDPFGRGYRFALAEIVDLSGYSAYFNTDRETSSSNLTVIANNNPASIVWRANALNFYVNAAPGVNDGITTTKLIVLGHNVTREAFTHESGHYLGLCHTHGCPCPTCDSTNCPVPPVSDRIADTLPDNTCWDQDDIATNWFNKIFANLNLAQQNMVSNTFNNIMCYHLNRKVFTSDQLDELADTSNGSRNNLTTGFTWFVDRDNICISRDGSSACAPNGTGGPFQTVTTGVSTAGAGDIVLIRPGHYNEPMTISKAVTLRATRGDALLGKP
jgi:hypothetical protein